LNQWFQIWFSQPNYLRKFYYYKISNEDENKKLFAKAWWKCIKSSFFNFKFHSFKFAFKFSNSSFKCSSISINSTRLQWDLQRILESLCQFLLTNIIFFKFSNCKWYFLGQWVRQQKFKSFQFLFVIQQFPIFVEKIQTLGKMDSYFFHHCKGHFFPKHPLEIFYKSTTIY